MESNSGLRVHPKHLAQALTISVAGGVPAALGYYFCHWSTSVLDRIRLASPHCENTSNMDCELLSFGLVGLFFLLEALLLLALGLTVKRKLRCWPGFSSGAFMGIQQIWGLLSIFGGFWTPDWLIYLTVLCGAGYGTGLLLDVTYLRVNDEKEVA